VILPLDSQRYPTTTYTTTNYKINMAYSTRSRTLRADTSFTNHDRHRDLAAEPSWVANVAQIPNLLSNEDYVAEEELMVGDNLAVWVY
jgi:hypothetical protein